MSKHIIVDNNFHIRPSDIHVGKGFQRFWDAFGDSETEISASYVVKLCQKKGGWLPFTQEEIEEVYRECGHHEGFTFNQLVDPQAVLVQPAEEFGKLAAHANLCHGMDPFDASISYTVSHGKPETVDVGGGWIAHGSDKKYYVTEEFVTRCFQSSPAKQTPESIPTA